MNLYAIKLPNGKYHAGTYWKRPVDTLEKAKIYTGTGPARGAITYHSLIGAKLVRLEVKEVEEL